MIQVAYDQQQAARVNTIAAAVHQTREYGATVPVELLEAVTRVERLHALIHNARDIDAVIHDAASQLFDTAQANERTLAKLATKLAAAKAESTADELASTVAHLAADRADIEAIRVFKWHADTLLAGMQPHFNQIVEKLRELARRIPVNMTTDRAIHDDQTVADWRAASDLHDDYATMRRLRAEWATLNLIANPPADTLGFNVARNADKISGGYKELDGFHTVLELLRRGAELWLPTQAEHHARVEEYLKAHRPEVLADRNTLRNFHYAFGPGLGQ